MRMKRAGNLIERVVDMANLRDAYRKTALGKRGTLGYLEFKEYAELNLSRMRERMLDGDWQQSPAREFTIYEPKERLISALGFTDRIAQHALVNVIGPLLEATLLPYAFACRAGLGTHAGVRHVQSGLRYTGAKYFLKTDYSKFFASVDRARLYELIERKIKCRKTLAVIRAMVPATGRGLPIGNLTSQLFANVYAGVIDRFIHFELGSRQWSRYMDDVVILSSNRYELRRWFDDIEFTSLERLGLTISHWQVAPVASGINFLGYRIWPRYKLLRKQSVTCAKRKVERYLRHGERKRLGQFIASWRGHAAHADTCNLFNSLEQRYGIAFH